MQDVAFIRDQDPDRTAAERDACVRQTNVADLAIVFGVLGLLIVASQSARRRDRVTRHEGARQRHPIG